MGLLELCFILAYLAVYRGGVGTYCAITNTEPPWVRNRREKVVGRETTKARRAEATESHRTLRGFLGRLWGNLWEDANRAQAERRQERQAWDLNDGPRPPLWRRVKDWCGQLRNTATQTSIDTDDTEPTPPLEQGARGGRDWCLRLVELEPGGELTTCDREYRFTWVRTASGVLTRSAYDCGWHVSAATPPTETPEPTTTTSGDQVPPAVAPDSGASDSPPAAPDPVVDDQDPVNALEFTASVPASDGSATTSASSDTPLATVTPITRTTDPKEDHVTDSLPVRMTDVGNRFPEVTAATEVATVQTMAVFANSLVEHGNVEWPGRLEQVRTAATESGLANDPRILAVISKVEELAQSIAAQGNELNAALSDGHVTSAEHLSGLGERAAHKTTTYQNQ